jgi:hypothetical protein
VSGHEVDPPERREHAHSALALAYEGLAALWDALGEADSDQDRSAVLLQMITQAWLVRDRATEAYSSLQCAPDADGSGRGVAE